MSTRRRLSPSPRSCKIKRDLLNPTAICRPIQYLTTPLQLSVIASYLNQLRFIEQINARLIWDPEKWKYSPGVLAQLLVLLPFISANKKVCISRIHEAYAGIDLELLVGEPIDPTTLNDDMFGRLLDRLFKSDCSSIFSSIALSVRLTFNLPDNFILHSDTTSHVLYGDYECDEGVKPYLTITQGYSKQKRDDLKQIMTGMVTDGDGLILYCTPLDGNTADCSYNYQVLDALRSIYSNEFKKYTYIADSKLLTEPNFKKLNDGDGLIRFIARIPENFHKKIAEKSRNEAYAQDNWVFLGSCCSYPDEGAAEYSSYITSANIFGYPCNIHVFRSSERERKVEKSVQKASEKLKTELQELEKIRFACLPDAITEKERFLKNYSKALVYPELNIVCEEEIKRPRGRPGKNSRPPNVTHKWRITLSHIVRNEENIGQKMQKTATFSLLTNISLNEMKSDEVLVAYKGQGKVENNFKLLKEPLMAATIFLEKDTRIVALMTMLYFSALMHGLLRVITNIELTKLKTPPKINSNNRPLVRPTSDTMIWLLSLFAIRTNQDGYEINSLMSSRNQQAKTLFQLTRFNLDFVGPQ